MKNLFLEFRSLDRDWLVTKIPVSILNIPKAGTVGIHNSLLPAYQGGASLNWALIKDYSSWGCTLFHLEENIDAGEIIFQDSFNITDNDDINTLFLKSDKLSIEMINRYLPLALKNSAPRIKQNPSEISKTPRRNLKMEPYAGKLTIELFST